MTPTDLVLSRELAALRARLDARAVGAWRVSGGGLVQVAFVAASDLPVEVAEGFAAATLFVARDRVELAIARAAATGVVVVSIASELPAEVGSGYWLRAFGAARSVAVPLSGIPGSVDLVVSVALGPEPAAEVVRAAIVDAAPGGWPGESQPLT